MHLHFGAVDYWATVWVNGVEVARHEGGHTPFAVDISPSLRGGENELVVRADDPLEDLTIPRGKQYWKPASESIFYTATTGIWQTVWLEPLPRDFIRGLRLEPDLAAGVLDFEVDAEDDVELVVRLAGHAVGRWRGPGGRGRVELDQVVAWTPDTPALYEVEVRSGADRVESYFGLRSVAARDGRFLLNGEPFVQRLVLDQGYFPGGLLTAPDDAALRADIELAKACGFNGARKHQKLEDPRWLYWADVLGFLVWSEMPSFHQHSLTAEARLKGEWPEAIRRDRDHPCVAAWVPLNESFGLRDLSPDDLARFEIELYEMTHALDGSRPVSANDGWEHARTDLLTLHDYAQAPELAARYASLPTALDPGGRPYPPYLPGFSHRGEPVIVSEFGGIALAGSSGWGYGGARGGEQLLAAYGDQVAALMDRGPVEGFCYTQLTDIEQETNGLFTFERVPKVAPERLRPLTETPKRR